MIYQTRLKADPLPWLLEAADPGVRYLALRDVVGLSAGDPDLAAARRQAHRQGPIAAILDHMQPEGYWVKANAGYGPKYRSTDWSVITLAQLGANISEDERIATACKYILEHTQASHGRFATNGTPYGNIDCLQGNLAWALLELGLPPERLEAAFTWMARSVTGEGVAPASEKKAEPRFYSTYNSGPGFACGINGHLPCAWGAIKVMLAFSRLPAEQRTPLIERAIRQGTEFLLSADPALADYPFSSGSAPSKNWWKLSFPVFYVADVLQNLEVLARLGAGSDPRLRAGISWLLDKQDGQGRWPLEYSYSGRTWTGFSPNRPNKWVTLRALRTLKLLAD